MGCDGLPWATARRLDFIDIRLADVGTINRGDLMAIFGTSVSQAAADFRLWKILYPGTIAYDNRAKTYRALHQPYTRRRRLSAADRATLETLLR